MTVGVPVAFVDHGADGFTKAPVPPAAAEETSVQQREFGVELPLAFEFAECRIVGVHRGPLFPQRPRRQPGYGRVDADPHPPWGYR
jgi:hypothetical protein